MGETNGYVIKWILAATVDSGTKAPKRYFWEDSSTKGGKEGGREGLGKRADADADADAW